MNNRRTAKTIGLLFSKDRAMQLDAALRSFYLHCRDIADIELVVLYTASAPLHQQQYAQLMKEHSLISFISENQFKTQVCACLTGFDFVLFLVDDNLFVQDFLIKDITMNIENNDDALAFSLRLGRNTTYCYPAGCPQELPQFLEKTNEIIKFDWTVSELDFAYPLEVSSSLYRVADLQSLLEYLSFNNPNTLESLLAACRNLFRHKKYLLCYPVSRVFSNPINIVQKTTPNRTGETIIQTASDLSQLFQEGYRVAIEHYAGVIPHACHQEMKLLFTKKNW
ncbi:MAG: hypothetical protein LLG02_09330 [Pelosinus sp.]|nr:hypothetical protein [Pelosinus sp.]